MAPSASAIPHAHPLLSPIADTGQEAGASLAVQAQCTGPPASRAGTEAPRENRAGWAPNEVPVVMSASRGPEAMEMRGSWAPAGEGLLMPPSRAGAGTPAAEGARLPGEEGVQLAGQATRE